MLLPLYHVSGKMKPINIVFFIAIVGAVHSLSRLRWQGMGAIDVAVLITSVLMFVAVALSKWRGKA